MCFPSQQRKYEKDNRNSEMNHLSKFNKPKSIITTLATQ